MLKQKQITLMLLTLFLILVSSCRKVLEPTEFEMSEYGWTLYSDGEYSKANVWFREAVFEDSTYKDGYNGLGWTFGKLGKIDSSITNFLQGRSRAFRDTTDVDLNLLLAEPPNDVGKESTAGLALAYHAKNIHERAIIYGNSLLYMTRDSSYTVSEGSPNWTFSRDTDLNAKYIIWTLASSYYAQGNFGKSLAHVHQLMSNPTSFAPDSSSAEGWWDLSNKIEFLRDNL